MPPCSGSPAALEILEADFWIQYTNWAASKTAKSQGGSGNLDYTEALEIIED
jgi:hypothetical protein